MNCILFLRRATARVAALLCAAVFSAAVISCKPDEEEEIQYYLYHAGEPTGTAVELSADDPVSGVYSTECQGEYGSKTAYIFRPAIAYATASSCAKTDAPAGTEGTDYVKINVYGTDTCFNLKDANKVYAVYNTYSDADTSDGIQDGEIDKHSGVIIFQAKYSPYGKPNEGFFYGVKFQFLTKDGKLPTQANKNSFFSETKVYIEGGYNAADSYNTVSTLKEAVEKFGFANGGYFASSGWTSASSGADKTGRTALGGMPGAVFTKAE